MSAGTRGSANWLAERGLTRTTEKRWHCEVSLATIDGLAPATFDDRVDTRFHIDIYSEEWGFFFCHGGRASWIRVTDIPFVHGRDDFQLLPKANVLGEIGSLLRGLESTHRIKFHRKGALVRTNVEGAEATIRSWVEAL